MIRKTPLRSAALWVALPLLCAISGCAGKSGPAALQVSISLDDAIYAPGEAATLTVRVANPDDAEREVQLPNPANTKLYSSRFDSEGALAGSYGYELGASPSGAESLTLEGGGSIETDLPVTNVGDDPGSYLFHASYRNGAEPAGAPVASGNDIEVLIE